MRIAYVLTRGDSVGGAAVHVRDVSHAMLQRGHEVTVVLGGTGAVYDQLARLGIPLRIVPSLGRSLHPIRDAAAFQSLGSVLADLRPHLVSTHTAKAGWLGRAAAARLGLPAIHTPHGLPVGDRLGGAAGLVFTVAERAAARWCRAIVCVCEAERRLALRRRIAAPEKLRVIPNGVHDIPQQLRAQPQSEPPRIVSIARFAPPKDHDTLLRSLLQLRDLEWHLDLVGDGPLESAIRALAGTLGLRDRITFHGYVADPSAILARGSVFALCSRSEAFPRSILEAMRAGLPIVASDVGGVSEAVENGVNGTVVPPETGSFTEALRCIVFNPRQRQLLGMRSRQIYESRYRFEQLIEATENLYGTVASVGKA